MASIPGLHNGLKIPALIAWLKPEGEWKLEGGPLLVKIPLPVYEQVESVLTEYVEGNPGMVIISGMGHLHIKNNL